MRAVTTLFAAISLTATVACGGSEPPPATPATPPATTGAKGEAATGSMDSKGPHDEHGAMKPSLHDFHETLAPIWHTNAGAERITKACTGEKDLRAKAAAVGDAELTAAADAVKTACDKEGRTDVEGKLSVVHDRFHKLAEQK